MANAIPIHPLSRLNDYTKGSRNRQKQQDLNFSEESLFSPYQQCKIPPAGLPQEKQHKVDSPNHRTYLSPLFYSNNQSEGYSNQSEDYHAQQNLEKINEELQKRNEELKTLLHLISHDLKTPLRGISLTAQWLMEDEFEKLSRTSQRYLETLLQRIHRAETLLDDVTQYFFYPAYSHQLEKVTFDMLAEEFHSRVNIPKGFQVDIRGKRDSLYTKKVPLIIILCNLLDNAVKHHHYPQKGRAVISVQEEDHFYRFTVADNGPGFSPVYYEYIFGVFNKLKPKDDVEGSGMGLAIVKKLLTCEGGHISVSAEEGKGATFTFTWPKWPVEGEENHP
jgi:signal transduction histidine kinase